MIIIYKWYDNADNDVIMIWQWYNDYDDKDDGNDMLIYSTMMLYIKYCYYYHQYHHH